jgi:hypothetical protein
MKASNTKERARLFTTSADVLELNDAQLQKKTVETPLPIIYKTEDGMFEELSYLDLSRRHEVCGVLTKMLIWPLVGQRFNILYFGVENHVETSNGEVDELCLPNVADFESLNEEDVNATFQILRTYGLECEDFVKHGVYWTRGRNGYTVAAYSFASNSTYYVNPSRRVGHFRGCVSKCRLCISGKLKKQ